MKKNDRENHETKYKPLEQKHSFRVVEDGNAVKNKQEMDVPPVYIRPNVPKKKKRWLPPVIITIISAMIIGTVLGIMMLELFVGVNDEIAQENSTPTATTTSQSTSNPVGMVNTGEPQQLSAHVIQAGLFVERANVEEWSKHYETMGEPAFIWEEDGQFYLFIGIYATSDEAKAKVTELQEEGLDVFTKPWITAEKASGFSKEEKEWMDKFHTAWQQSLTDRDESHLLQLREDTPPTDVLEGLSEKLTEETPYLDEYLLELMFAYDNL